MSKPIVEKLRVERAEAALEEALAGRVDRLVAMLFQINSRLAAVEARAGVDAPDPLDPGLIPVKRAAHLTGFSESYVRKLVKTSEKVRYQRLGGRLFVDPQTLPKPKCK